MFSVLWAFANFVVDLFKSRRQLEAENLLLRHYTSPPTRFGPPTWLNDAGVALRISRTVCFANFPNQRAEIMCSGSFWRRGVARM